MSFREINSVMLRSSSVQRSSAGNSGCASDDGSDTGCIDKAAEVVPTLMPAANACDVPRFHWPSEGLTKGVFGAGKVQEFRFFDGSRASYDPKVFSNDFIKNVDSINGGAVNEACFDINRASLCLPFPGKIIHRLSPQPTMLRVDLRLPHQLDDEVFAKYFKRVFKADNNYEHESFINISELISKQASLQNVSAIIPLGIRVTPLLCEYDLPIDIIPVTEKYIQIKKEDIMLARSFSSSSSASASAQSLSAFSQPAASAAGLTALTKNLEEDAQKKYIEWCSGESYLTTQSSEDTNARPALSDTAGRVSSSSSGSTSWGFSDMERHKNDAPHEESRKLGAVAGKAYPAAMRSLQGRTQVVYDLPGHLCENASFTHWMAVEPGTIMNELRLMQNTVKQILFTRNSGSNKPAAVNVECYRVIPDPDHEKLTYVLWFWLTVGRKQALAELRAAGFSEDTCKLLFGYVDPTETQPQQSPPLPQRQYILIPKLLVEKYIGQRLREHNLNMLVMPVTRSDESTATQQQLPLSLIMKPRYPNQLLNRHGNVKLDACTIVRLEMVYHVFKAGQQGPDPLTYQGAALYYFISRADSTIEFL